MNEWEDVLSDGKEEEVEGNEEQSKRDLFTSCGSPVATITSPNQVQGEKKRPKRSLKLDFSADWVDYGEQQISSDFDFVENDSGSGCDSGDYSMMEEEELAEEAADVFSEEDLENAPQNNNVYSQRSHSQSQREVHSKRRWKEANEQNKELGSLLSEVVSIREKVCCSCVLLAEKVVADLRAVCNGLGISTYGSKQTSLGATDKSRQVPKDELLMRICISCKTIADVKGVLEAKKEQKKKKVESEKKEKKGKKPANKKRAANTAKKDNCPPRNIDAVADEDIFVFDGEVIEGDVAGFVECDVIPKDKEEDEVEEEEDQDEDAFIAHLKELRASNLCMCPALRGLLKARLSEICSSVGIETRANGKEKTKYELCIDLCPLHMSEEEVKQHMLGDTQYWQGVHPMFWKPRVKKNSLSVVDAFHCYMKEREEEYHSDQGKVEINEYRAHFLKVFAVNFKFYVVDGKENKQGAPGQIPVHYPVLRISNFLSSLQGALKHYSGYHNEQTCGLLRRGKLCTPFKVFAVCEEQVKPVVQEAVNRLSIYVLQNAKHIAESALSSPDPDQQRLRNHFSLL